MQAWNQLSNKPKIAIALPYNTSWSPEWVINAYVPLWYIQTDAFDKAPFACKVASLSVARDTLVRSALDVNADYIFFIDSDIVFEQPSDANAALKVLLDLMNKNKDSKDCKIISGCHRAKKKEGFSYAMWNQIQPGKYLPIEKWTGNWIEVDATGLGCCLIATEVFREIKPPWFYWEQSGEVSEDFYFFQQAKKHGYNLKCMTDVKLSHLGNMKVKWDGSVVLQDM